MEKFFLFQVSRIRKNHLGPALITSLLRTINSILVFILISQAAAAQVTDAKVAFTAGTPGFKNGTFHVILPDSTGFTNVDIKLFDAIKNTVVFERDFVFDQTTGLPSGVTWQRQGTNVQLGMGSVPVKIAWKGMVRVRQTGGQWSDWYRFLFD